MDLNIINQINESVMADKDTQTEDLKNQEKILSRNYETDKKIEQERMVITSSSSSDKSFGLNSSKSEKKSSFFDRGSSSSLDDFFKSDKKEEKEEKNSYGYRYGYGSNSSSSYKKEDSREEKVRKYVRNQIKQEVAYCAKEIIKEDNARKDSWDMFELRSRAEANRKELKAKPSNTKEKVGLDGVLRKRNSALSNLGYAMSALEIFLGGDKI